MDNQGELITKYRIGFEKTNIALGFIYKEWYELISKNLSEKKGLNIELGCGASFIDQIINKVTKTDVFDNKNTDLKLDAMEIGSKFNNKVSNIILVNVFHHISNPELFLRSAEKSLLNNGRILMIEPSNNIWSRLVYKLVGHEIFDPNQRNWNFESTDPLLDSNQALSWIIFKRDYEKFKTLFPNLNILKKKTIMPLSYLISGGHTHNTKVGKVFINVIRKIEKIFLDKYFGIFNFICIEKS